MSDTQNCSEAKGQFVPQVDRNKCEGKADCVRLCPYAVFEIQTLRAADKAKLSLRGRLKAWAHKGQQAYVVNPQDCHACNLCVQGCPESALTLIKVKV